MLRRAFNILHRRKLDSAEFLMTRHRLGRSNGKGGRLPSTRFRGKGRLSLTRFRGKGHSKEIPALKRRTPAESVDTRRNAIFDVRGDKVLMLILFFALLSYPGKKSSLWLISADEAHNAWIPLNSQKSTCDSDEVH